jgi:DNA helicase IV
MDTNSFHDGSSTIDKLYLRMSHAMIDSTALASNVVVMGKKNLKPGLSTTISPGNRSQGILPSQGQSNPASIASDPRMMSIRFIWP